MPYKKPWYMRLDWPLVMLMAMVMTVALAMSFALWVVLAEAGGPVAVTWSQDADCPSVTGWELLVAPITTAVPNPAVATAAVGASIANAPPVTCGPLATKTVVLNSGVGPARFWLKAVAGSLKSVESNSVDTTLPFAKPGLLSVVP